MITPTASFKDNLAQLPAIEGLARAVLTDPSGAELATIENAPGKQGSLKVYQYLAAEFGQVNVEAATHGLEVFAEHTADARANPGAHPNIDHLLKVIETGEALTVTLIKA